MLKQDEEMEYNSLMFVWLQNKLKYTYQISTDQVIIILLLEI